MGNLVVILVAGIAVLGLIAIILGLGAFVTMWAWNMVVAGIFHGPSIGIWQALAVNVLLSIVGRGVVYVSKSKE